jgi:uncharacterized protein DUF5681
LPRDVCNCAGNERQVQQGLTDDASEVDAFHENEMKKPPPTDTRWKPGQSGNPTGRQLGSRNKLGEQFICDLYDDWKAHGAAVIEQVRTSRPDVYLKVVAGILPRELHFRGANVFEGLSDEQLDALLVDVRRTLASKSPASGGAGSETPSGDIEPSQLH